MNEVVDKKKQSRQKSNIRLAPKTKGAIKLKATLNRLIPLVDGPEIFGSMGDIFSKAKKYIYIAGWNFRNRTTIKGKSFKSWLLQKSKEGVKIRILWCDLDAKMNGGFKEAKEIQKLIKSDSAKNISVVLSKLIDLGSSHANTIRDVHLASDKFGSIGSHHQKIVIVDGLYAICNGADITPAAINKTYWHDASAYIQGEGVKGIEETFVNRWNTEAPKVKNTEKLTLNPKAKPSNKCKTILTEVGRWNPNNDILDAYQRQILNAKKSIYIENQYLRHPAIGLSLTAAANKGIEIYILIPKFPEEIKPNVKNLKMEHKMMHYAQFKVIKAIATGNEKWITDPLSMLKKGTKAKHLNNVTIVSPKTRQRPYIHAKLMIIDGKYTNIGSANTNKRSMDGIVDSECNVEITDESFTKELIKKLEKSKRRYPQVTHDIDRDEVITRFNQFNIDNRNKKWGANTWGQWWVLGSTLISTTDRDVLREELEKVLGFLV